VLGVGVPPGSVAPLKLLSTELPDTVETPDAVTDPVKDTLPCTVTFAPENNEPHLPIVGVPVNASAPLIFHDDP
jgi:hypothetical protein